MEIEIFCKYVNFLLRNPQYTHQLIFWWSLWTQKKYRKHTIVYILYNKTSHSMYVILSMQTAMKLFLSPTKNTSTYQTKISIIVPETKIYTRKECFTFLQAHKRWTFNPLVPVVTPDVTRRSFPKLRLLCQTYHKHCGNNEIHNATIFIENNTLWKN